MAEGAFLGLLKGGGKKSPKPKRPNDAVEGEAYSKVGKPLDDSVDDLEPDADEDDGGAAGASFASLADALGIPEEKRAQAQAALESFVKSCSMADE